MRAVGLAAALALLAACQAGEAAPAPPVNTPAGPARETRDMPAKVNEPAAEAPDADARAQQPAALLPAAPSTFPGLELSGRFEQSGLVIGRTLPNAEIRLDEVALTADEDGWFVLGFDRDAAGVAQLRVQAPGFETQRSLVIEPRVYETRTVSGLPQSRVTPTDPEDLKRIAAEREVKNTAFSSIARQTGFRDAFVWPVSGRITSPWGAQRVLNGVKQQPHYGVDIGAPQGTTVRAPAGGVVVLAEADMFFEGGFVAIDHGQGLISMYLHMSRIDVRAGDVVAQGAELGAVGMRGRATGPHLCWRLRWRGRQLDPALLTQSPAPPPL
jgi:murein DD-endopeptidase MepM/ murein hydrolase activator NlpD